MRHRNLLSASLSASLSAALIAGAIAPAMAADGPDCSPYAPWAASTIYKPGDRLVHNNMLYQALTDIWAAPPDWAGGVAFYKNLGPCGSGEGNQLPQVQLNSPGAGSLVEVGQQLHLAATASDADGSVVRVDFLLNGAALGSVDTAPFVLPWTAVGSGAQRLVARAWDDAGASADSAPVSFRIGSGGAADTYNPASSYEVGCVVILGGDYFRAKWYANPGQSPAQIDPGAPWNSPWEASEPTEVGCAGSGNPGNPGNPDPDPDPTPDPVKDILLSSLVEEELRLTDFPLMQQTLASIRTLDNASVQQVRPGRAANPDNVRRVEDILGPDGFDFLFPLRAPQYTYTGLLQAFAKFPAICQTYADGRDSNAICRKTLATMVAHFAQETGGHDVHIPTPEWRQALVHVREMGWTEDMRGGYNGECNPATWQGQAWPCGTFADGAFKSYFGRGAKQLSYNYNYGPFSEAIFGTVRTLLDQPERVADTWLNLASATFFYMYPQPPKPSMLHVIDGSWQPNADDLANGLQSGFGVTTQIINGGVECGGAQEHLQSVNRIRYYREAAAHFGVPIAANEVLGCKGMKQFDESGAGALPIYWEQNHDWVPSNPGGASFACKLVGYQTAYSAMKSGDYAQCVMQHFPQGNYIDDL